MISGNKFFKIGSVILFLFLSLLSGVGIRAILVESSQSEIKDTAAQRDEKIVYERSVSTTLSSFLDGSVSYQDRDFQTFFDFKNQFIESKANFIEADLRAMTVRLWQNGELLKELPIASKGRDGSWWETPTGKYRILTKENNHFSSIGQVWMPWSMQFYGNFFIHGWPYHEDGAPVPASYSGGCVRLATEDARQVFDFAERDMPVLVLDNPDVLTEPDSELVLKSSQGLSVPDISAKHALVIDLDSGLRLLDKQADEPAAIASLTKLMTGVVGSELIYLGRSAKIMPFMLSLKEGNSIFSSKYVSSLAAAISLAVGSNYTVLDIFYPMLVQSSNEAANAVASFVGRDSFVEQMNQKAKSLGMTNTEFVDPSGIGSGNIATAGELADLAKYILEKRHFLFSIGLGKDYTVFGPNVFSGLDNYNEFIGDQRLLGVKNGQTQAAGQTLLTVWQMKYQPNNSEKRIAIIVLGAEDRQADTKKLLTWLEDNFQLK